MKAAIILLVSGLLTALAFYLVWMNRASEKILTAVIPVAVAGLAGVFIAVFVFGGEPAITAVFPSSFQYRLASKMPANLPWLLMSRRFTPSQFAPARLYKVHPEFFTDPSDKDGATLYHHLLQRAIIDWMGMLYSGTWQLEILQFELPSGHEGRFQPAEGASKKSETLSTEQVESLLKGNKFADMHAGIRPQITLPPGTKMKITPPQTRAGALETGEILLENKFCSISIKTEASSWFAGIRAYKQLAGINDEENNGVATANYIVRINDRFDRLRSSHPQMALYKSWASELSVGLRKQFDEQVIWSKTKDDFVFSQLKGQFGEQPPLHQTTVSSEGITDHTLTGGVAPDKPSSQSVHGHAKVSSRENKPKE